jgi:hypothetical protein
VECVAYLVPHLMQSAFLLDVFSNVLCREDPGVPLGRKAIRTDQELLKVPRNVSSLHWTPAYVLGIAHQMVLKWLYMNHICVKLPY